MTEMRIKDGMSQTDQALALAGGVPSAIIICSQMTAALNHVDKTGFASASYLLLFDTFGIYEDDIHCLKHAICGGDLGKMMALLWACRSNAAGVTKELIHQAIDDNDPNLIDFDAVIAAITADPN